MAATKKELEDKINRLTDEVRQLRKESKESEVTNEATLEGLGSEAHGIILKDDIFTLVSIKFDAESNKAVIENIDDIGKSIAAAASKVKHAVIDSLVEVNKRRG